MMRHRVLAAVAALSVVGFAAPALAAAAGLIPVIGVENEYADVISQIGGKYVQVQAIETDPNTDPHSFEASPKVAKQLAGARIDRRKRRRLRRLGGQDHERRRRDPTAR